MDSVAAGKVGEQQKEEATSSSREKQPPPATSDTTAQADSDLAKELTDSAPSYSQPLAVSNSPSPSLPTPEHHKGLLDNATEFINDNLKTFRQLPWIIGGVGVVLLIRFYPRMVLRRYCRPSDIPRQLFENNARLTGVVAVTGWDSVGVWHVPLWRRVLRWRHQPYGEYSEDELLNVKFAGVAVGSPERSEKWLERTLLGERVWFTLLDHTPQQKSLSSIVHTNKHKGWLRFGRKWCVNEELLAQGLGSLDEVTGFKNNKDYTNFIHRLGRRETVAKRTGAGMWKGSEYVSSWRRFARLLRLSS